MANTLGHPGALDQLCAAVASDLLRYLTSINIMKHKTTRPANASGKLASDVVTITPVKPARETVPTHWLLTWEETPKTGTLNEECKRTGNTRADLREFAKKKLGASLFLDGTGEREIKL